MTEPRDDLARRLYVEGHQHQNPAVAYAFESLRGVEWDGGKAPREDVADCYARADEILGALNGG